VKFAYADPPYPGRARRWYREETTVAIQGYGNAGSWLAVIVVSLT
jgi:glutamate dehydrogenase/leucine dehydrogenase